MKICISNSIEQIPSDEEIKKRKREWNKKCLLQYLCWDTLSHNTFVTIYFIIEWKNMLPCMMKIISCFRAFQLSQFFFCVWLLPFFYSCLYLKSTYVAPYNKKICENLCFALRHHKQNFFFLKHVSSFIFFNPFYFIFIFIFFLCLLSLYAQIFKF